MKKALKSWCPNKKVQLTPTWNLHTVHSPHEMLTYGHLSVSKLSCFWQVSLLHVS
jgi:hypothetical protein